MNVMYNWGGNTILADTSGLIPRIGDKVFLPFWRYGRVETAFFEVVDIHILPGLVEVKFPIARSNSAVVIAFVKSADIRGDEEE